MNRKCQKVSLQNIIFYLSLKNHRTRFHRGEFYKRECSFLIETSGGWCNIYGVVILITLFVVVWLYLILKKKKISYLVRGADEQGQLCPGGRGHHAHRPRGQCGRGIPGIQDQSIMRAQPLCTQQQRKPVISCSSNTVQCTLYSVQYSIVYSVQSGSFSWISLSSCFYSMEQLAAAFVAWSSCISIFCWYCLHRSSCIVGRLRRCAHTPFALSEKVSQGALAWLLKYGGVGN